MAALAGARRAARAGWYPDPMPNHPRRAHAYAAVLMGLTAMTVARCIHTWLREAHPAYASGLGGVLLGVGLLAAAALGVVVMLVADTAEK